MAVELPSQLANQVRSQAAQTNALMSIHMSMSSRNMAAMLHHLASDADLESIAEKACQAADILMRKYGIQFVRRGATVDE